MKTNFLLLASLISLLPLKSNGHGVCIVDAVEGTCLLLKSSTVDVLVDNQIAVVTTTQTFSNTTGEALTFRYGFPLHSTANAIELKWYINGKWHKTVISSNPQQDSLPGGGGGNEIDPGLAEFLGNTPLFVTPEDTIMKDSTVTFILKYVELLPYAFGIVDFHYPNRYDLIQPGSVIEDQHFLFELKSDRTIELIAMESYNPQINQTAYYATLILDQYEVEATADFGIHYQLSSTELGVLKLSTYIPDSLLHCDEAGQGFVSLIIEPESNVNTEVIEKNFTLIIDRSGSMSGEKIIQARNAATFIVEHLNMGDNFNIVDFSTNVTSLYPLLMPATPDNRQQALEYISNMNANGTTNISGALTTSIFQFGAVDTTKANIIIFLTDGMATAGVQDLEGILNEVEIAVNALETRIFLFTFGIGLDVDKKLLTLLALENSGLAKFLDNGELEEEITYFFQTINNPVLLNTQYSFEPDIITNVFPSPLPNLYKGQQLIMSGRYQEPAEVTLHLSGKAFNLPVKYDFTFNLADTSDVEKSFLPKIWAKQAIDQHTIHFQLADSEEDKDSIQAIVDSLSICYGVVSTQFTSFEDGGEVVAIEYEEPILRDEIQASIYPTPFLQDFTISINSKQILHGEITILLLDGSGQIIYRETFYIDGKTALIPIHLPESLPSGTYYVVMSIGEETIIEKAIKL